MRDREAALQAFLNDAEAVKHFVNHCKEFPLGSWAKQRAEKLIAIVEDREAKLAALRPLPTQWTQATRDAGVRRCAEELRQVLARAGADCASPQTRR